MQGRLLFLVIILLVIAWKWQEDRAYAYADKRFFGVVFEVLGMTHQLTRTDSEKAKPFRSHQVVLPGSTVIAQFATQCSGSVSPSLQ